METLMLNEVVMPLRIKWKKIFAVGTWN